MPYNTPFSLFVLKLQSIEEKKGSKIRFLAQRCFLWSLYTKGPITAAQLTDAVTLEYKISTNHPEFPENNLSEMRDATCNLLLISGFSLSRVRPLNTDSERFLNTATEGYFPDLKAFFPTPQDADIQLSSYCMQNLLVDAPPADGLFSILPYCASFFDAHIRSLQKPPDSVLYMLDKLLNSGPTNLRRIISFRYPTIDDEYPNIDCPGSPVSIDPAFFLRCVNLDRTISEQIWSGYFSNKESYPTDYLHLASLTGLTDVVDSIISICEVGIDRKDRAGFTALQYATEAGQQKVIKMLLRIGTSCNDEAKSEGVTKFGNGVNQRYDKRTESVPNIGNERLLKAKI